MKTLGTDMICFKHLFRLVLTLAAAFAVSGCIQDPSNGGAGGQGGVGGGGGAGGSGGVIGIECSPGSMFQADDGCNRCQCPASGLRAEAACTERACPEQCDPDVTFDAGDGCNTCLCPATGIRAEAACTERVCAAPCDGRVCGETCQPQDGAGPTDQDGAEDQAGFAPRPSYACDLQGHCVPEYDIDTCEVPNPCRDAQCGDPCRPEQVAAGRAGAPDQYPEPPNTFCDVDLNCVPVGSETLACEDRCAGRSCGQPCRGAHGQADRDIAPGTELCSDEGACVFVAQGAELVCEGGGPCDGIACGEPCFFNAASTRPSSGEEESDDSDSSGAPQEMEPEQLVAPDGVCDVRGVCRPASQPIALMCEDPAECVPGELFEAGDGCNTCQCPDSGLRSEAACDEAVCQDPACADLECGDMCEMEAASSGAGNSPEDEDEAGFPAPPARSVCDANLRCVWEYEHAGCGM